MTEVKWMKSLIRFADDLNGDLTCNNWLKILALPENQKYM